jgi:hypothetical protein
MFSNSKSDLDGVFGIDANGGLGIANAAAAGLR